MVWACEHFMIYLLGIDFTLVTDHQPLQYIYNSTRSKPLPRIERWTLRLMAFNFKVVYKPGPQNIADPLSRLAQHSQTAKVNVAESYIRQVAEMSVPKSLSWSNIRAESLRCAETKLVCVAVRTNDWSKLPPTYRTVSQELSKCDGVILRSTKILVPVALR